MVRVSERKASPKVEHRDEEEEEEESQPRATASVPEKRPKERPPPRPGKRPAEPSEPPQANPEKAKLFIHKPENFDVDFFGKKSFRMRKVLQEVPWKNLGPQYLGEDGMPRVYKVYYMAADSRGDTPESKKVTRYVCVCVAKSSSPQRTHCGLT